MSTPKVSLNKSLIVKIITGLVALIVIWYWRAPLGEMLALIGDRDIEIKITGIRPGEKMHEIMVSDEECHHTVRREGYYAIQSMLPELNPEQQVEPVLSKEFSSEDTVLSFDETVQLLSRSRLLVGQAILAEGGELLA